MLYDWQTRYHHLYYFSFMMEAQTNNGNKLLESKAKSATHLRTWTFGKRSVLQEGRYCRGNRPRRGQMSVTPGERSEPGGRDSPESLRPRRGRTERHASPCRLFEARKSSCPCLPRLASLAWGPRPPPRLCGLEGVAEDGLASSRASRKLKNNYCSLINIYY